MRWRAHAMARPRATPLDEQSTAMKQVQHSQRHRECMEDISFFFIFSLRVPQSLMGIVSYGADPADLRFGPRDLVNQNEKLKPSHHVLPLLPLSRHSSSPATSDKHRRQTALDSRIQRQVVEGHVPQRRKSRTCRQAALNFVPTLKPSSRKALPAYSKKFATCCGAAGDREVSPPSSSSGIASRVLRLAPHVSTDIKTQHLRARPIITISQTLADRHDLQIGPSGPALLAERVPIPGAVQRGG